MEKLIRIGMDTSKSVFQLHGVNAAEEAVLGKQLRRSQVLGFFAKLEATRVGIEACGGAHYWARELGALGHDVVLLPPQYVKPYVKRGKNDAADAEAICEAMSRPSMRVVPVKSAEQRAARMLVGLRASLVRRRTQLTNAVRGYAAEFGLTAAKGLGKIEPLLAHIAADNTLPELAKELFAAQGQEYARLQKALAAVEARPMTWHRGNEVSLRLVKLPGVGPIGATLLAIKAGDAKSLPFGAGLLGMDRTDAEEPLHRRQGPAWRHHPRRRRDASKRAGGRCDRSDPTSQAPQRTSLALAGRAVEAQAAKARRRRLANKTARIAWKLMVSGERYNPTGAKA